MSAPEAHHGQCTEECNPCMHNDYGAYQKWQELHTKLFYLLSE